MYLLDTNVLSEPGRAKPDENVKRWLTDTPPNVSYTAAIVLAELLSGAEMHPDPVRRKVLHRNLEHLLAGRLNGRVLSYDEAAARSHARLLVATRSRPKPRSDLHIAAVALANRLTLVTRNTSDFAHLGLPLLNPWET